jgi:hypothetical protein
VSQIDPLCYHTFNVIGHSLSGGSTAIMDASPRFHRLTHRSFSSTLLICCTNGALLSWAVSGFLAQAQIDLAPSVTQITQKPPSPYNQATSYWTAA